MMDMQMQTNKGNVGRPKKRDDLRRKTISVSLPNWMIEQLKGKAIEESNRAGEEVTVSKLTEISLKSHYGLKFEYKE